MTWCDKLASTPTIGLKFSPHVVASDSFIQAWSPLMDELFEGDNPLFSVEIPDALAFAFTTNDGFKFAADKIRVSVAFQHRMKVKAISGGPPVMEMLSVARPYSELLDQVAERLSRATLLLPDITKRRLLRVGVVSTTQVDQSDLPPGIAKLIDHLGKPWGSLPEVMNTSMTHRLRETDSEIDKCVHLIKIPDDPSELMTVHFDWSREFKSGRPVTSESIKAVSAEARKGALAYFEDLAEGGRFE